MNFLRFKNSSFLKNIAVLSSGVALSQMLALLISPLVTRLYSPEDIGLLGVFLSVGSIFSVLVTFRYELAIVGAENEKDSKRILAFCVLLAAVVPFLVFVIIIWMKRLSWLGLDQMPFFAVLFLVPFLVLVGLRQSFRFFLVKVANFSAVSRQILAQGIVKSITQLSLPFYVANVYSLILGEILGLCIAMVIIVRSTPWKGVIGVPSRKEMFLAAKKYKEFPLLATPSALLGALSTNLRVPLVLALYGAAEAGFLTLVFRVVSAPITLIQQSVGDSFYSRVTQYRDVSRQQVRPLFLKTTVLLVGLGGVFYGLLVWQAEEIFALVFGESWRAAGRVASSVSFLAAAQFVVGPLSRALDTFNGQREKLYFHVANLLALVAVYILAELENWDLDEFIMWLVLTAVVLHCIYVLKIYRVVNKALE